MRLILSKNDNLLSIISNFTHYLDKLTSYVYSNDRYIFERGAEMIVDYGKTQQELNEEYNSFIIKLSMKANEIKEDYLKLSYENQSRFIRDTQALLRAASVADMLNEVANWRPNR